MDVPEVCARRPETYPRNGTQLTPACPSLNIPVWFDFKGNRWKHAFLPCGHLDFESAVTAQNDEFKGRFHSSYSRLSNVET